MKQTIEFNLPDDEITEALTPEEFNVQVIGDKAKAIYPTHETGVSVIIPCYNQGEYLEEVVESVLNSTYKDLEIIIVDDCSTDNSLEVVKRLIEKDKRIRAYHNKVNQKLPQTRNIAIERAKYPYILPLDADDKISNQLIEKYAQALGEGDKGRDIIYCDANFFGEENAVGIFTKDYDYELLKKENIMVYCAMFRKEHWREVGGYNKEMTEGFEDWLFWIKMGHAGHYGHHLAIAEFFYRVKKQSMIKDALKKRTKLIAKMRQLEPECFIIIPKKIYWTWQGDKKIPDIFKKCYASWKKFCPDYEIIEIKDVPYHPYTARLMKEKKYGLTVDYIKMFYLYHFGGIWLDIDAEIIKPIDEVLEYSAFFATEEGDWIGTGFMGCEAGHPVFKKVLEKYNEENGLTTEIVVKKVTEVLTEMGWEHRDETQYVADTMIYNHNYLYPHNWRDKDKWREGKNKDIKPETLSIHHYAVSWKGEL